MRHLWLSFSILSPSKTAFFKSSLFSRTAKKREGLVNGSNFYDQNFISFSYHLFQCLCLIPLFQFFPSSFEGRGLLLDLIRDKESGLEYHRPPLIYALVCSGNFVPFDRLDFLNQDFIFSSQFSLSAFLSLVFNGRFSLLHYSVGESFSEWRGF